MSSPNWQTAVVVFDRTSPLLAQLFGALPSVKFITGLQYVISLIKAIPAVLAPLLKGASAGFGVVSPRLGWYGEGD